jgi:hypothetical protein
MLLLDIIFCMHAFVQSTSVAESTLVLMEATRLRIIPLMQMLLFKDTRLT